jgi:hypothetical protein
LIVHVDNARPQTAYGSGSGVTEIHGIELDNKSSHPVRPYSPDFLQYDFSLFGCVKHCLREQSFEAFDELFSSIEAVFRGIKKSTFNAVFLEWMERLEQCNATNGDDFEDT